MRSTLTDVAREAGVSAATVDRVLNNRPGVRERTRTIVVETARRLGYLPDALTTAGIAAAVATVRLDFVLPEGTNSFIRTLRAEIEAQAAARPGLDVRVATIEGFNPDTLAATLRTLHGETDGIGLIALDHPLVREAMRALADDGTPVVTLATDVLHVPRTAYVGLDNRQAGRLAGYVLGRLIGPRPANVALFAGSLSYRGHQEREMGFRAVLAEEFPHLAIVELREVLDDRARAYAEAAALLDRHPDLAGLYNIGAGNPGIARALHERGRARSVVFLGHELTEGSKPLLLDGTLDGVIDQNPRVEARESLNLLVHALRRLPYEGHPPRLHVIFKENIPEL